MIPEGMCGCIHPLSGRPPVYDGDRIKLKYSEIVMRSGNDAINIHR
jgi:hypothetical protein